MHYAIKDRKEKINQFSKLFYTSSSDVSVNTASTIATATSTTSYHRIVETESIKGDFNYENKDKHYEHITTSEHSMNESDDNSITKNDKNNNTNTNTNDKIALILYGMTTIFLYADQNLLAPNLTKISNEFNFTDYERDKKLGGDLSMAFFLFAAPASIIVGIITDKYPSKRSMLFASCVFIGEGSCLLTYFTTTYKGLFITRLFTGFSIGGAVPILYTLIGDYFSSKDRSKASAILGIGCGIGVSLGQGLSGYVGSRYGWRLPFLIVSIPALFLAILVFLFVKDPERGAMEKQYCDTSHNNDGYDDGNGSRNTTVDYNCHSLVLEEESLSSDNNNNSNSNTMEQKISNLDELRTTKAVDVNNNCENIKALLQTRSFILLLCQGVVGCIPWGIVNTYLNDYFSEEKNLSVESATTLILFFGVGAFLGISSSGCISALLYTKYGSCYPTLYAGIMTFLAPFPLYVLMDSSLVSYSFLASGFVAMIGGIFAGAASPVIKSTLINVTYPSRRGIASSLHIIFDDVGKGLGPFIISMLIGLFNGNRTHAFNYGFIGWMLCGFLVACISLFVQKDEERVLLLVQEQQSIDDSCAGENDDSSNLENNTNKFTSNCY